MDFDKMFGNPNTQVYREEERDRMKKNCMERITSSTQSQYLLKKRKLLVPLNLSLLDDLL